jgi:class 3 adenylate cyclase
MPAGIMPRHIIQHFAIMDLMKKQNRPAKTLESLHRQLAKKHTGVALMFMDIVGFTSMAKVRRRFWALGLAQHMMRHAVLTAMSPLGNF